MKNSKRILGVVLALIMVFNVLAVGSFAAFPDDTLVKLTLSTDDGKATYAPGDDVTIAVYQQVLPEAGQMSPAGSYEIAYDSSVIKPYSTTEDLVSGHALTMNSEIADSYDSSISKYMEGGAVGIDERYNWNAAASYIIGAKAGSPTFDCTSNYKVFTIKMKIADDAADGTYTIGFNKIAFDSGIGFVADGVFGGFYGNDATAFGFSQPYFYDLGTCEIKVSSAPAEPEVVALDDTMARMDDWTKAESTDKFDGGLIGQINNLNLTFTDGDCDQIDTIEVYANGKKMGNAYQVYKVDDTTYQFRAVIKNMDKTDKTYADDIEYEFKVTLKGDYAGQTLTATKTVSAQAIYAEAYAAYQTANA